MVSWCKPNTSQTSDPLASQTNGITTTPGQGKPILINQYSFFQDTIGQKEVVQYLPSAQETQSPFSTVALRKEEDNKTGVGTQAQNPSTWELGTRGLRDTSLNPTKPKPHLSKQTNKQTSDKKLAELYQPQNMDRSGNDTWNYVNMAGFISPSFLNYIKQQSKNYKSNAVLN